MDATPAVQGEADVAQPFVTGAKGTRFARRFGTERSEKPERSERPERQKDKSVDVAGLSAAVVQLVTPTVRLDVSSPGYGQIPGAQGSRSPIGPRATDQATVAHVSSESSTDVRAAFSPQAGDALPARASKSMAANAASLTLQTQAALVQGDRQPQAPQNTRAAEAAKMSVQTDAVADEGHQQTSASPETPAAASVLPAQDSFLGGKAKQMFLDTSSLSQASVPTREAPLASTGKPTGTATLPGINHPQGTAAPTSHEVAAPLVTVPTTGTPSAHVKAPGPEIAIAPLTREQHGHGQPVFSGENTPASQVRPAPKQSVADATVMPQAQAVQTPTPLQRSTPASLTSGTETVPHSGAALPMLQVTDSAGSGGGDSTLQARTSPSSPALAVLPESPASPDDTRVAAPGRSSARGVTSLVSAGKAQAAQAGTPMLQAAGASPGTPTPPHAEGAPVERSSQAEAEVPYASTATSTPAARVLSQAQWMHTVHGSTMQVSVPSGDLGRVTVRANYTRNILSAQITADNSQLGAAIAAHLPVAEQKLLGEQGMRAVFTMEAGTGGNGSQSNANESRSGGGTNQAPLQRAGPTQSASASIEALASAPQDYSLRAAAGGGINIRI